MPRSVPFLLVALALLATACGGGDGDRGPSTYGDASGPTTTAATDTGANGAAGDPGAAPTSAPTSPLAPPTTARPGSPTTDRTRSETDPAPPTPTTATTPSADHGANGPPGAFARTLLRPAPATAIVLERHAQDGAAIAEAAVSRSASVLREVSGKPVDTPAPAGLAGGARAWTADELRQTADAAARTSQGEGGRAVIRILLVRGTFESNRDVLGIAVRGDVFALFPDSIDAAATPLVTARQIGDAVLLHELGHLLGLVDLARDTGRADPDHPGHSRDAESVMYWAVESSLVGQVLGGPPPTEFDADDRADLEALRNGA